MSRQPEVMQVSVPRETAFLTVIRRMITEAAEAAGFTPIEAGEVEVAVDAVATSAVSGELRSPSITVAAVVSERGLEVILTPFFIGAFDREVVLACVDEVEVANSPDGTPASLRLRRFRRTALSDPSGSS